MRLLTDSDAVSDPSCEVDDATLAALYSIPAEAPPSLRMNFVTSIDGAVAVEGVSAGLSSAADKRVFGLLRDLADAVVVAAGTLRQEDYGPVVLSPRRRAERASRGLRETPTLVVVTGTLNLEPSHRALAEAPTRPVIVTHAGSPPARRAALSAVADVFVAGTDTVDLALARNLLHERGLRHLLCEGGPYLFGALTSAGCVDEVCLTISPLLAGGAPGRISAGPPLPSGPPPGFRLAHVLTEDGMLFLRYVRR
jgi:riboflavin biosynthesis pyrimidine reductase